MSFLPKEMIKHLPKGVKIMPNGQMEVKISFDVTKHGHSYEEPRNYDISRVTQLVRSEKTQEHIKNGYCKGFYGHTKRNPNNGFIPHELDGEGNQVEPVCVTKSLSIQGKMITHVQRIYTTDDGIKLQKLIANGGAGFSAVWSLVKLEFYGFDAVVSQKFAGNRVIVDSICSGEYCSVDNYLDSVAMSAVHGNFDVKDIALELLKKQTDVKETIEAINAIKSMQDRISELEGVNSELNSSIHSMSTELNSVQKEIELLQREKELMERSVELSKSEMSEELKNISTQLSEYGIKLNDDGTVSLDNGGLSKLFKPCSFQSVSKNHAERIKMLSKQDIKKSEYIPVVIGNK